MRKIRPTRKALDDFAFFFGTDLDMIGVEPIGEPDPNGYSALECWYAHDTYGQTLPCRDPELLAKVERSKKSWNLQIKIWAEDIADGTILKRDEFRYYCDRLNAPEWIFEATMNQAAKICRQKVGFVPSYARLEKPVVNEPVPS